MRYSPKGCLGDYDTSLSDLGPAPNLACLHNAAVLHWDGGLCFLLNKQIVFCCFRIHGMNCMLHKVNSKFDVAQAYSGLLRDCPESKISW